MSRMIDQISRGEMVCVDPFTYEPSPELATQEGDYLLGILGSVRLAEVYVIDNVADYLLAGTEQEEFSLTDFPNCAPPHPVFWMEYRYPQKLRTAEGVKPFGMPYAAGILFIGQSREDAQRYGLETGFGITADGDILQCPDMFSWIYTFFLFLQKEKHAPVLFPVMHGSTFVGPDGALQPHTYTETTTSPRNVWRSPAGPLQGIGPEHMQAIARNHDVTLFPAWLALSFLHCKNVTTSPIDPCHTRKPTKRGEKCRLFHYGTLNIRPMQRVLRHEGRSEQQGLRVALHICRGHFKDYRERGLFGRNYGVYWWESRLRGSSAMGIREKHYNVDIPRTSVYAAAEEDSPHA